ncbi:MAG: COG1361 S-layer family protein, partial [Acidobacteriaceae bacterium]
ESGTAYTDSFVISLPVFLQYYVAPTATPTPTQTPIPSLRPQLVITGYASDVTPLQPGIQFNLSLEVKNLGSATAKRVTMIVGGGSSLPGGDGGTQQPGGISGASGEFTNFAPIGSSNVQSLGEFVQGDSLTAYQPLIVNVNTSPGAYPLKISFVYLDENNHSFTDDQVITLLVYRLPSLDISFYQQVPPMYTFQPNMLPIQVVNLGRNSVVLGTMRVTADSGQFSNNSILVGTLEPGGYFTLDATFIPDQPGPVDLVVSIDYTDDFNFPQVVTKTVTVEVIDQPVIEPPMDGGEVIDGNPPPAQPETFLQKVWRFFRGLLGLDSGPSSQPSPGGEIQKETPVPQNQPIIVPGVKGP